MKIHPMWHEYPTLAPELASALTLIEKQITTNNTPVAKAIMEMINGGGKLLRPAYCLLFSRFQDTDREKMIALAAAIETLHTATLIHDDIIDKSPTRRNQVTIQKQFGPDTAVYAGDYLFVVCFKLQALATGVSTPLMFHLILTTIPQTHLGIYVGPKAGASEVTTLAMPT